MITTGKVITQLNLRGETDYESYPIGAKAENVEFDSTASVKKKINELIESSTPEKMGFGYAICNTAEDVDNKIATLTDYNLVTNGYVTVKFLNPVNSNATLNINNKGSKPIYYKDAALVDDIIHDHSMCTFVYDGSHYQLLAVVQDTVIPVELDHGVLNIFVSSVNYDPGILNVPVVI